LFRTKPCSTQKNYHNEKTLAFRHSRVVSHAYPLPYGFVIDTTASDGGGVDCFVITDRELRTGQIVECEPIGLMEQFEDGVEDHNVLAKLLGETSEVTQASKQHLPNTLWSASSMSRGSTYE
jgi:inorganic pyrophosphatase